MRPRRGYGPTMRELRMRAGPILRGVGVAALAGAYLAAMGVEPPIHADTARDILLARDGLLTGVYEGCSASFGTFRQGALWVRFMALSQAIGLGLLGQHLLIAGYLVLGVCLFDRLVRDHFGDDLGWASTAMFLPLVILAVGYPVLWNPTVASLGIVVLTWSLLGVVTRGSTWAACASAASLALVAEASWSALLIAPVLVLAILISCARPWRALLLAAISGLLPSLAASWMTWTVNVQALLRESWYLPFVAAAVAAGTIGALAARRRWLALAVAARRRWLLVLLVGTIAVETAAASVLARRLMFSPQYLFTALPAAVILAALGLNRLRRSGSARWRRAVAYGVPVLLLSIPLGGALAWRVGFATGRPSIPTYTMREAQILARRLFERGLSIADLRRHVRGPDSLDLVSAIAAFAPDPQPTAERQLADLRIIAFTDAHRPAAGLPPDGEEIDLGRGRRAWILPLESWVGLAPSRVCFSSAADDAPPAACAEIASPSALQRGPFQDLAFPSFPGVHEAFVRFAGAANGAPIRVEWELPIAIRGDDAARDVALASVIAPGWTIVRVEGVGFRGDLPARHVRLDRSIGATGRLAVAFDGVPSRDFPPELVETRAAEETALRDELRLLPPLGPYLCATLGTCP